MLTRCLRFAVLTMSSLTSAVLAQQIENWAAPPFWSPPARMEKSAEDSSLQPEAVEGVPSAPLPFVAIAPCRIADTRGNGFTGQAGPPALSANVTRTFQIGGTVSGVPTQCGIPLTAQAVSFQFTSLLPSADGNLIAWPGGPAPTISVLNWAGGIFALGNGIVVPISASGALSVRINGAFGSSAHLTIDVNGYYGGSVVTTLNGLSGGVTLAEGSNVTITPSGQTLTVAATGGPGGSLPAGTSGQTLRHNGSAWVANSALTSDGTDATMTGILKLPPVAQVFAGTSRFLHNAGGSNNTFLGVNAGSAATGTTGNTGVGYNALYYAGGLSGYNVAVGAGALFSTTTGQNNTAIGTVALENITSGSGNIAIGAYVGTSLSTGSSNLYIGSAPAGNESNQIRIGRNDVHTQGTVIASIYGFGSSGGIPVIVNSGGRLGTTTSSRRFKLDIRDIGAESDGLMDLRPVAFKYKPDLDPTGLAQYGLIAEEVAEIYPELVVYDEEGRPETIRYQLLDGLLLNEVQKQRREIEDLKARLAMLEARLEGKPTP
jgi:Chaperone of endosialidase